jgi:prevent-host-death family protein
VARKVSIADARNHLPGLVHEVERGKRIDLTRRGQRVAVLVSSAEYDRLRRARPSPAEALRAWRSRLPDDFEGLTEDEVEAWRDRSPGRTVRLR